jgi:hypothetical protein
MNLRPMIAIWLLLAFLSGCVVPQKIIPTHPIQKAPNIDAAFSINSSRWWEEVKGFVEFEIAFSLTRECNNLYLSGDVYSGTTVIGKLSTSTANVLRNTVQIKRGIVMLESSLPPTNVVITSYKCSQ